MRFNLIVGSLLLGVQLLSLPALAQDFAPDNVQAAIPWNGQIQSVNVQTGAQGALQKSEDGVRAKWSPNGRYVLFMTGRSETSIRLYDTKTSATTILGGNLTFPVAWREDNGRLAMFHVPPTGKNELIQYGVGEKGIAMRTPLSVLPKADAPMVWLPATDNVAYLGGDGNVYSVEEGEVKKITTSNDVIGLALSGNGKSLVWARRGPNPKYILVTFYTYDLSARSVRRIDFPGNIPGINPNPRQAPTSIESAVFSPDGTHVALYLTFDTLTSPLKNIVRSTSVYTVRMDGSGAKQVAAGSATSSMTSFWSRDSRTLAVLRMGGNGNTLLVSDADGQNVRSALGATR